MRHHDEANRIQTPARLIQVLKHLTTVEFQRFQLVITNVWVNGFQGFQACQFGAELLIGFTFCFVDERGCLFANQRFACLQHGVNVRLNGVHQLA